MLPFLILLFVVGYLGIALEHPIKIDKSATALLLGMLMWVAYALASVSIIPAVNPGALAAYVNDVGLAAASLHEQCLQYILNVDIVEHLGDITQTLFFLIGAMTIVELIDVHEGFTVLTDHITTRRKRTLLMVICGVTFILSAVLDNLTTTIVMLMLLRKLVFRRSERWLFAGMIIIAANTGGAWSPIGDVTTIMLWVKGNVTTQALISFVLVPSLVALIVPMLFVLPKLKGDLPPMQKQDPNKPSLTTLNERKLILILGVAGLLFVPLFKSVTHLPPFVGILLSLGVLWVFTEIFYNRKKLEQSKEHRLSRVIKRIDMSTILFFFGILMAVAVLQSTGILATAAGWLDFKVHNVYIISSLLGVMSSIVDNVPLVAAAMGMYPIEPATATGYAANFVVDGTFWEFLSYCAGVGGSILIIGSAAGVIAMGIEKIPFGWYLRKFSLIAFLGYAAGALIYVFESVFLKSYIM